MKDKSESKNIYACPTTVDNSFELLVGVGQKKEKISQPGLDENKFEDFKDVTKCDTCKKIFSTLAEVKEHRETYH